MRRKLRQGLLLVAATLVGLLAPQAGADIIIDDFDSVPYNSYYDQDIQIVRSGSTAGAYHTHQDSDYNPETHGIVGEYRELYVQRNRTSGSISLEVSEGASFSSSNSTSAPEDISPDIAHITWDGNGSALGGTPNFAGPLTDFSSMTYLALQTKTLDADRFAAIQLWDTSGNTQTVQFLLPEVVPFVGAQIVNYGIGLSNFTNVALNQIGAIRLHFLTDDITFLDFRATNSPVTAAPVVPVPPALALGALGMAVVAGFRRRSSASVA